MRWGSPERDAPDESVAEEAREPAERRAVMLGRSAAAPVVLALTTIAALAGAVLALLPAALAPRPAGRLGPRSAAPPSAADLDGQPLSR